MDLNSLSKEKAVPDISVYMTVKDGEDYVEAAIESIILQSIPNWEMVIVDDGSQDGTNQILDRLQNNDNRIRVVKTKGIGRGKALNLALTYCRAPVVANLDADDLSHPMRLECQLAALRNNPRFGLISTSIVTITADQKCTEWCDKTGNEELMVEDVGSVLAAANPICHSSVAAHHDVLLAADGYDTDRYCQFDYELWVRLGERGVKLGRLNTNLVAKRFYENQTFARKVGFAPAIERAKTRARAIRCFGGGYRGWLLLPAHFLWDLVPWRLRLVLRG